MQKTIKVDNIEQYYQPTGRKVLPHMAIIHETPLFSNIHGTDITIKAATGQTWSQSLLISPRTVIVDILILDNIIKHIDGRLCCRVKMNTKCLIELYVYVNY